MIIKEEFLVMVRKIFNLNMYESRVWTGLLSRGTSTAGELSNISDVPRSRTYDILESLAKKGYIMMQVGKPIKFIALKPEEVIERVKKNLMVDAQAKSKRLEELKGDEVLLELTNLFENGIKFVEHSDLSGSVKGRQNVNNHMDMMVRSAENSITIITTADGLNRKMDALMPSLEQANKRGVKIKIGAPITSDNIKVAKQLSKVAEVRDVSNKKMNGRFVTIDNQQLMLMLTDDKTVHPNYDVGVWMSTDFAVQSINKMIEHSWSEYKPLSKVKVK